MASEIKASPLLTDEDLQLILSATAVTPSHTHSPGASAHIPHWWQKSWRYLAYSLPVALSIGWLLHFHAILIVGVALPLLLAVLIIIVNKVCSYWSDRLVSQSRTARSEYYSAMDKLLTQLTVTIRWLQEAEIVGWGLTRPLTSLPASRLDQCHTHRFLRGRVLHTCRDVLVPLRVLTRQLCTAGDVKLTAELEDRGSYLAFRQLHQLHAHMKESSTTFTMGQQGERGGASTGQPWETEGDEEKEILSLDSIKASTLHFLFLALTFFCYHLHLLFPRMLAHCWLFRIQSYCGGFVSHRWQLLVCSDCHTTTTTTSGWW